MRPGILAAVALSAAISWSRAAGSASPGGFPDPEGKCIFISSIEDWHAEAPDKILVRTRARGWQYEITLIRRCARLQTSNAIRWNGADNRICDDRADSVAVREDVCPIGSIRPLEPVQDAPQ